MQASSSSTEAFLRDGASIRIRPGSSGDATELGPWFRLSPGPTALRALFPGEVPRDRRALELWLSSEDPASGLTLVALCGTSVGDRIVGIGRYSTADGCPRDASRRQVALWVRPETRGLGVGTLLLEQLVSAARSHQIAEFETPVLGEGNEMLRVFASSGFAMRRSLEDGRVRVAFPTGWTERSETISRQRERCATARSVRPILEPSTVAVVGASAQPSSIGGRLFDNLSSGGFSGRLFPVNPKHEEIGGRPCYPSVSSIGSPIDLAFLVVPAAAVEQVVDDCAEAGVRALVVISAGFAEVSAAGRRLERRILRKVREAGMRMVGPNCMGVLNTDPAIGLDGTFVTVGPPAGNVGILSQSGALGYTLLEQSCRRRLGVSSFVSAGNKADVSSNDLLAYWSCDSSTQVIALYLESFGNIRKFARIAPEVARVKPIVALKSGRSAAGSRAASSHSAALASLDVAVDALFEQAGVLRADTLDELFDVVSLLSSQPVPSGTGVGVVTNAGGPGVLLADACAAHGLSLPEPSEPTVARLREVLPEQVGLSNPIDLIASATPEQFTRTIELLGNDPQVDSLVVIYIPVQLEALDAYARAIALGAERVPSHKPIACVVTSSGPIPDGLHSGTRGTLPCYTLPESAARSLSAAERYGRWRRRPRGTELKLSSFARGTVRAVVDRALRPTPTWLSVHDVATILRAADIGFAPFEVVAPDDAVGCAERMGYPLVAKAIAPGLLHKTDVGGVVLGLESSADVESAVVRLRDDLHEAGFALEHVQLQREVGSGIEAMVGITRDATLGALVVCGLGGVLLELVRDVGFRLPPVTDVDAHELLDRLRASRLLDGFRGQEPGDRTALVDVIRRVSALIDLIPELLDLDLNPVMVLPPGRGAVAVDARMRIGPTEPDTPGGPPRGD